MNWEAEKLPEIFLIFFFQTATVTGNLIYGKKMKPSAEKPSVNPKAIICCCGMFHIAEDWTEYAEVSEKTVFLARLQISHIMNLVVAKCYKRKKQAEKISGSTIHIFHT